MKKLLLTVITILTAANVFAQQNVGIGTTTPDASAVLDLAATDKGFLVPRVTQAERLAILNPARGLMVYDIDADCFYFFSNIWVPLCQSNGPLSGSISAPSMTCAQTPPTNGSNVGFTFDNDKDSGIFGIRQDNTTPLTTMTELRAYLNGSEKLRITANRVHFGSDVYSTGTFTTAVGFQNCSDYRFKKDFTPITSALDNIGQIQAYSYFWKQDEFPAYGFNNSKQIGFIAQEIEKFYPEVVSTDANGYKSVDYGKLTPVLLVAVNELNDKVTKLQAENDALKAKVDNIDKALKMNGIEVDAKAEKN
jgi:Chaperone of endosialidase